MLLRAILKLLTISSLESIRTLASSIALLRAATESSVNSLESTSSFASSIAALICSIISSIIPLFRADIASCSFSVIASISS